LDPWFTASNPANDDGIFNGDKNPQHDLIRTENKAVGAML
jgi:hypothetical protein